MELIHTPDETVEKLTEYLGILCSGVAQRENWDAYEEWLVRASPVEVNAALDRVLSGRTDMENLKQPVARFIRAASKGIEAAPLPTYPAGHTLAILAAENQAISARLDTLMHALKVQNRDSRDFKEVHSILLELGGLADHYRSLQNGLFPLFESATPQHSCVQLMWSLEDDVLKLYRDSLSVTSKPESRYTGDISDIYRILGTFFTLAQALVFRETRILFPVAWRMISPASFEAKSSVVPGSDAFVRLSTGSLSLSHLEALFKLLPVDVSFIGNDDRVLFYSDPPHRIFPRTPAVIGRLVQNCHPPKSVATVEKIIASFRDGSRDTEEFWLEMHGRFIHIQYFAARDPDGAYLGTLEVSMDATHIRTLEGEKRLL